MGLRPSKANDTAYRITQDFSPFEVAKINSFLTRNKVQVVLL